MSCGGRDEVMRGLIACKDTYYDRVSEQVCLSALKVAFMAENKLYWTD